MQVGVIRNLNFGASMKYGMVYNPKEKNQKRNATTQDVLLSYDTAIKMLAERKKLAARISDTLKKDDEIQEAISNLSSELNIESGVDLATKAPERSVDSPIAFVDENVTLFAHDDEYEFEDELKFDKNDAEYKQKIVEWIKTLPQDKKGEGKGAGVVSSDLDVSSKIEEIQNGKRLASELLEFLQNDEVKTLVAQLPSNTSLHISTECNVEEGDEFLPGEIAAPVLLYANEDDGEFLEVPTTQDGNLDKEAVIDWLEYLNDKYCKCFC